MDHTETQLAVKVRRPSAVSQVLRAISEEEVNTPEACEIRNAEGERQYQIRVAADLESRRKAYHLAYRVYRHCGYIEERSTELCVSNYDAYAGTMTLLAQDQQGREAGTMTMVFDSSFGLPCCEIYPEEVESLRQQGRNLVEFTRLAIDDAVPNAKALLFHLFHLSYAFARCGGGASDMLIEVNPRHVQYYKRMLRFEQIGAEKPCPRVKGAPAVLLRMNFADMDAKLDGHSAGRDGEGKRLHPYMFSCEEERRVADFLAEHHRAMSFTELRNFSLCGSSASLRAVCAAS